MLAYDFPPVMVGGVIRPAKFCKYLPDFGWAVTVLTCGSQTAVVEDSSFLKELSSDVHIVRTKSEFSDRLVRWVRRQEGEGKPVSPHYTSPPLSGENRVSHRRFSAVSKRFYRFGVNALRRHVMIPDRQRFWKKAALREVKKLFREGSIHALYTTSPPQSVHLLGRALTLRYHIPWAADFRDQWTDNIQFNRHLQKRSWRTRLEKRMEYDIVRDADRVVSVTETAHESFQRRYPEFHEKFVQIPNGFDESDFSGETSSFSSGKFVLKSFGSVGNGRNPQTLLDAVCALRGKPEIGRASCRERV